MLKRSIRKYKRDGTLALLISGREYVKNRIQKKIKIYNGKHINYRNIEVHLGVFSSLGPSIQNAILDETMDIGTIELIYRHFSQETPIIELGAGIGIVSCHICNYSNKSVIVLEPNSKIIEDLELNKDLNDSDFEIINKAYTSEGEKTHLNVTKQFWGASTAMDREQTSIESIEIEGINLNSVINRYAIGTFSLVTNMEGGEYDLLYNEMDILREQCDSMVIGFHHIDEHRIDETITHIENNGFKNIESRGNKKYYFENTNIRN